MGELTREDVERVARLARLRVTDDETAGLAAELGTILEHFEAIRRRTEAPDATTDPVAGSGAPGEAGPDGPALRPDRVDPDPLHRPPSALAPEWRDGHFVVPRLAALGAAGEKPTDADGGDGGNAADGADRGGAGGHP